MTGNFGGYRLQVMEDTAAPTDQSLQAHVELFLTAKRADVDAEQISAGRLYALTLHLNQFADWLGGKSRVSEINAATLAKYRGELLERVEAKDWSRATAADRLDSVKSFVRWLWHIEAIAVLPRNMDAKSKVLHISKSSPSIVTCEQDEIVRLLKCASERTALYILLALNCGFTQKDIADLDVQEVDWSAGRISRKRSKTKSSKNVPEVCYQLWPETRELLVSARSPSQRGRVLLNESGGPLWTLQVDTNGRVKKNDNVRNAFARLTKKTAIKKSFKSLKKTSASKLRNNGRFASLEDLFLGHAPRKMSDRHYTQAPQDLLDEALRWLHEDYRIAEVFRLRQ